MTPTRRRLLAAVGAAGTAVLAGCGGLGGSGTPTADLTPNPPDGPVATAPLPEDPSGRTYAAMGASDAPVVTYVGNWKCPFCAEFAVGSDRVLPLARIVTDYVEPGDLRLRYRALAYTSDGQPFLGQDAPRAARAGLAVWNRDPDSYWAFHEYVMAHQPPESEQWATTGRLVNFARLAGVSNRDGVRTAIDGGEYEESVRATTDYAGEAGVSGTPTLVSTGGTASPFEPEQARTLLDGAVDG